MRRIQPFVYIFYFVVYNQRNLCISGYLGKFTKKPQLLPLKNGSLHNFKVIIFCS